MKVGTYAVLSDGRYSRYIGNNLTCLTDGAPSRELQEKLAAEFKGHSLLEACRQADPQRLKKFLGADIINFKHPYTGEGHHQL